jgi:hypothetical protein
MSARLLPVSLEAQLVAGSFARAGNLATDKGGIQGESGVAIVDGTHQDITDAQAQGSGFHDRKLLEVGTPARCYFATPKHSRERGSNENRNGLIRQYLPKRTCLQKLTQKQCNKIAHALNTRPRKRHQLETPLQIYTRSRDVLHLLVESTPHHPGTSSR